MRFDDFSSAGVTAIIIQMLDFWLYHDQSYTAATKHIWKPKPQLKMYECYCIREENIKPTKQHLLYIKIAKAHFKPNFSLWGIK